MNFPTQSCSFAPSSLASNAPSPVHKTNRGAKLSNPPNLHLHHHHIHHRYFNSRVKAPIFTTHFTTTASKLQFLHFSPIHQ
uniref:Uncharacterized protein n=1 Tax=Kalanchoe fedtschenkoi TaxID=63787 RepID=A0A7N0T7S2_KALFE